MASGIKIKTKDICDALGVGRHQLRSWTDTLAPYCDRETKERSASRYDSGDLLFFAAIQHISETFGVSLSYMARFSESLYSCIREPKGLTDTPFVFISDKSHKCERLRSSKVDQEGVLVDLQIAQNLVYQYLGLSTQQTQLQLGLVKVN
tara:strand:- start:3846 stop:4292 length:447 start_codon:yes stop_codon:yes gene_type:complete